MVDWTRLKAFADDKLNVAKKMIFVFHWEENIVGKGENSCLLAFSLCPALFSKTFSFRIVKSRDCLTKV